MNWSLYLKHIRTHYIGLNFLFSHTRNIDLSKKKKLTRNIGEMLYSWMCLELSYVVCATLNEQQSFCIAKDYLN